MTVTLENSRQRGWLCHHRALIWESEIHVSANPRFTITKTSVKYIGEVPSPQLNIFTCQKIIKYVKVLGITSTQKKEI